MYYYVRGNYTDRYFDVMYVSICLPQIILNQSLERNELPLNRKGQPVFIVAEINALYLLYSWFIIKSKACKKSADAPESST